MPRLKGRNKHRAIPDDAIKEILLAPDNSLPRDFAERFGCGVQMVRDIRRGLQYRDILPTVERKPFVDRRAGCHGCVHYIPKQVLEDKTHVRNRCALGLAELREGGPSAGQDCNWFEGPNR